MGTPIVFSGVVAVSVLQAGENTGEGSLEELVPLRKDYI
jgi:hypothetical protein